MDEHKKELGNNKESVIKFLDNVFSNAKVLRKARAGGIFVVVDNKNTDKAAIIKFYPSKYGDYYNVESAGYYRKDKWKESENVIAELSEPTQSVTATDVSKPQVPSKHGMELLNAKTTITSTHKDSERRENNKISSLNFSSEPNSILSKDTTNPQTSNNLQRIIAQVESEVNTTPPNQTLRCSWGNSSQTTHNRLQRRETSQIHKPMTPTQLQQHLATLSKEQRADLFNQAKAQVTQHLSQQTVDLMTALDPDRLNRLILAQLAKML